MVNKIKTFWNLISKKLRTTWRHRRSRRSLYLWLAQIILAIVLAISSTLLLRQNNLNMTKLRDDLVTVDQSGDIYAVQAAAKKLQNYVAHHMNTATGRVALQTLYNQAAEAAMEASRPPEISTDVYQRATNECYPQLTNYGYQAWASCVADKVGINAEAALIVADAKAPNPDLYYIEYVPARWSGDPAGILLLLLVIDIAAMLMRLAIVAIRKFVHYCRNKIHKGFNRG